MRRPTNQQAGLLFVSAVAASVIFLVYFMLIGGYSFLSAVFVSLICALLIALLIYLFLMTGQGTEFVGRASSRLASATGKVSANIGEKISEAKRTTQEIKTNSADTSEKGIASKPKGLDRPIGGAPDDLKQIRGVGPKLEAVLNELGYFHFSQVAEWSAEEVAWVDDNLEGFKGRVTRDKWVSQAKTLAYK